MIVFLKKTISFIISENRIFPENEFVDFSINCIFEIIKRSLKYFNTTNKKKGNIFFKNKIQNFSNFILEKLHIILLYIIVQQNKNAR